MTAPDLWHRLWQLVLTYPALALVLLIILSLAGTLIGLALVPASKPATAPKQVVDMGDADDYNWIDTTGRMPIDPAAQESSVVWRRSGGNWWPIP